MTIKNKTIFVDCPCCGEEIGLEYDKKGKIVEAFAALPNSGHKENCTCADCSSIS